MSDLDRDVDEHEHQDAMENAYQRHLATPFSPGHLKECFAAGWDAAIDCVQRPTEEALVSTSDGMWEDIERERALADALAQTMKTITARTTSGRYQYITANGVPMDMPAGLHSLVRDALDRYDAARQPNERAAPAAE